MKSFVLFLLSACLLTSGAVLADLRAGLSAYQRGDYVTARAAFEAGARSGDPESQYMLGQMYAQGRGTLQNYVEAHRWYNLAAARGYGEAVQARDALERRMTPTQIAEAQRLAGAYQTAPQAPSGPTRATVQAIQSELNRLGYSVGSPDGVAGTRTSAAIRSFERSNGLPETGRPSDALLLRLRQSTRNLPSQAQVATGSSAADDSAALIAELERVIDEGERKREAQPAFLQRLRAALRQHAWPWKRLVFSDDFKDGDFTRDVLWEVASGRYQVGYRQGLTSRVQASAAAQGDQEIGKVLLKAIINEVAGGAAGGSGGPAEIFTTQSIGGAFLVQAELAAAGDASSWELGVYQGNARQTGYRLVQHDGSLQLVRSNRRGSSVIEMTRQVNLSDGASHALQWSRDAEGNMQVQVDGNVLLNARDRGVSGDFDGVVLVNHAGEVFLRAITVMDAR